MRYVNRRRLLDAMEADPQPAFSAAKRYIAEFLANTDCEKDAVIPAISAVLIGVSLARKRAEAMDDQAMHALDEPEIFLRMAALLELYRHALQDGSLDSTLAELRERAEQQPDKPTDDRADKVFWLITQEQDSAEQLANALVACHRQRTPESDPSRATAAAITFAVVLALALLLTRGVDENIAAVQHMSLSRAMTCLGAILVALDHAPHDPEFLQMLAEAYKQDAPGGDV